jgi:hypothetical protein
MNILTHLSFSEESACLRVHLFLKLGVLAFQQFNSRTSPSIVSHGLPFEAFDLESIFKVGIHLELPFFILIVIKLKSDSRAVHVSPDILKGSVHKFIT